MEPVPASIPDIRELSWEERALIYRMLELAGDQGRRYFDQLEHAYVLSRCPCGCPSLDLAVRGLEEPSGPMQAIGDFVFPDGGGVSGISIFAQNGILAELEVHAMSEETPMELPNPDDLLTYDSPRALELVSLHMPDQ